MARAPMRKGPVGWAPAPPSPDGGTASADASTGAAASAATGGTTPAPQSTGQTGSGPASTRPSGRTYIALRMMPVGNSTTATRSQAGNVTTARQGVGTPSFGASH